MELVWFLRGAASRVLQDRTAWDVRWALGPQEGLSWLTSEIQGQAVRNATSQASTNIMGHPCTRTYESSRFQQRGCGAIGESLATFNIQILAG